MKIVINKCHGGFGLSHAAIMHWAELSAIVLYNDCNSYYTVPVAEYNEAYRQCKIAHEYTVSNALYFSYYTIARDNIHLAKTVLKLGELADTRYSKLCVVDIPDGVNWYIDEHDGYETIREHHRSWN